MSPGELIVLLIVALICGFIADRIGKYKGRGYGFPLGFLLGIIGVIIVACLPRTDAAKVAAAQRQYEIQGGGGQASRVSLAAAAAVPDLPTSESAAVRAVPGSGSAAIPSFPAAGSLAVPAAATARPMAAASSWIRGAAIPGPLAGSAGIVRALPA
jgi:uncharacterized membrane protein YeaQ/YmgE (transglycosylase-associated protein family)